jgi:hypothetical protein
MVTILARPRQIESVTGQSQRTILPDIVRASAPQALANRRFQQEQERLDLLESGQQSQQRQQTASNVINAAGVAVRGAGLVRSGALRGIFGAASTNAPGSATAAGVQAVPGGATAVTGGTIQGAAAGGFIGPSTAAVPAAGTAPAAAGVGGSVATGAATPAAGGGTASASAGAGASGASGAAGVLGSAVAGVGAGLVGGAAGDVQRERAPQVTSDIATAAGTAGIGNLFLNRGQRRELAGVSTGIAIGAGAGFLLGGPVGAIAGGIIGGLRGSSICMIVTACHGADSEEVKVARMFRDAKMNKEQLRAYYYLSENFFVPRMEADDAYKSFIREHLVAPLIRYGRFVVGEPMSAPPPSPNDSMVAQQFLNFLQALGQNMPPYTRQNGEVF